MIVRRPNRVIPSVSRQAIDWENPLNSGLQFLSYFRENTIDLVTGLPGRTSVGAVDFATADGEVVHEPGNLDYIAFDNNLSLTDEWSILLVCNIQSFASWGAAFGIPYWYPGWSFPHQGLSLIAASTSGTHRFATGPADRPTNSIPNFWELAVPSAYLVTRQGTNIEWYRSGEHIGSSATSPGNIDLSNNGALCFGVRSDMSIGEGVPGTFYCGGIWSRKLEQQEVKHLSSNILAPLKRRKIWVPATSQFSVQLSGTADSNASIDGTPSFDIPLDGIIANLTTAQGILGATLPLVGQSVAISKTSGSLGGALSLSGQALSEGLTQAVLSMGVDLSGQSIAETVSSGVLALSVQIDGTAISEAYASGDISVSSVGTPLFGNAASESAASAGLAFDIPFSALSVSSSKTSGNVTSILPVTGAISAISKADGGLTMAVAISGDALTTALTSGDLTLRFSLDGSVVAKASAAAQLNINNGEVVLSGGATSNASNEGSIKTEARSPAYAEYIKSAKEARDDIAREGLEIEFTRHTKGASNGALGTVTKTSTTGKFQCIMLPASKGTIQAFDNRQDALTSESYKFIIVAAYDAPFKLRPGDKMYHDTHTWEVLGNTPVGPGGVDLIYRVGVKR